MYMHTYTYLNTQILFQMERLFLTLSSLTSCIFAHFFFLCNAFFHMDVIGYFLFPSPLSRLCSFMRPYCLVSLWYHQNYRSICAVSPGELGKQQETDVILVSFIPAAPEKQLLCSRTEQA